MNTRFGRHVMQDLADLSDQEIPGLGINRLAARYGKSIEERKARERAQASEFRLNVPHAHQVQQRLAQHLADGAARINGKLPVASVYDALQIVKARKDLEKDAGLRALRGHLESMWKRKRTATITASSYLKFHDHYARNFPKSAATDVIVEIGQRGYTTLPRADLHHIASLIETQADYNRQIVKYGLEGPQPHQVKARKYIQALLNGVDDDLPFDEDPESGFEPGECDEKRPAPKRQRGPREGSLRKLAIQIPMEEVDFDVWAEPEEIPIEGNVLASGDDEVDRAAEEEVRSQLEAGNEWAWCTAVVRASWTDPESGETFEGHDYLGACSYENEEQFKQPGGYYDDMKEEAYEALLIAIGDADVGMKGLRQEYEEYRKHRDTDREGRRHARPRLKAFEDQLGRGWTFEEGEDDYNLLRDVDIDGYRLRMWDAGTQAPTGQHQIRYVFEDPKSNIIFEGDDYGASPMDSIDSDETVRGLLGFLTLRPGDTDEEYFEGYTEEQLDFAETEAEDLQMWGMEGEEEYPHPGFKDWKGKEARRQVPEEEVFSTRPTGVSDSGLARIAKALCKRQAGVGEFTEGYIDAALWSSMDSYDEGGEPLDSNYGADDLAPETLQKMREDCEQFQADNSKDLIEYYDFMSGKEWGVEEMGGHDFWLTRNGHGAGFWDRGAGDVGERLTKAAEAYGAEDLYVGDDGKLYI